MNPENLDLNDLEAVEPTAPTSRPKRTLEEALAEQQARYDACMATKILAFPSAEVFKEERKEHDLFGPGSADVRPFVVVKRVKVQDKDGQERWIIHGRWSRWRALDPKGEQMGSPQWRHSDLSSQNRRLVSG